MDHDALESKDQVRVLKGLSDAFALAIDGLIESKMTGDVEEELTTGALVGSMASHAYWVSALEDELSVTPFVWTHYRKSGQDSASEPWTGADFALMLQVAPNMFRAAVFQAKRAGMSKGSFKSLQFAPARGSHPREPQIVRLARYGRNVQSNSSAGPSLHWVHYLGYQREEIFHVPLSEMSNYLARVERINEFISKEADENGAQTDELIEDTWKKSEVENTYTPAAPLKSFKGLLEKGCSGAGHDHIGGWLNISGQNAAAAFVAATATSFDVFEGASSRSYQPIIRGSGYEAHVVPIGVASQIRSYFKKKGY
ncbi:hypothetical protein IPR78_19680 [Xanthomonas perforans]|nr:hypothetical protein [Xanthomonas perforans]MBZ2690768.1 hypothetical protein [Xanthomonas perforans]MBZ2707973.1 hypothetical protein [Xanthomonas perforans]MBZ2822826.1 hypothetical protein [Xanthomonas perforans]MBZ2839400.1 hypothetical protein [Xanthomonas perforans]